MCNHHDQTKQYNLCAVNAIKRVVPKQRGIGTLKHVIYQSHLSLGEYLHPAHQLHVRYAKRSLHARKTSRNIRGCTDRTDISVRNKWLLV